jgi:pimeloyl-ACP methyl ester carboxylesterase
LVTTRREALEHQAIRLADGRLLGFAEYGAPGGTPVLYCHGEVGSRLLGRALHTAAIERGLRIVSPDRPGVGFSDFKAGRAIADWPADVAELTEQLGVEHFGVLSAAAGAPYALACAGLLAERLSATVLAGPVLSVPMTEHPPGTPALQRALSTSALWAPWTIRVAMTLLGGLARRAPDQAANRIEASAGDADRDALARPEIRAMIAESMAETFRSGFRGPAYDLRLTTAAWTPPLDRIQTPVEVWHGGEDTEVTPADARRLADALPHGSLHVVPGAGHHLVLAHPDLVLDPFAGGS